MLSMDYFSYFAYWNYRIVQFFRYINIYNYRIKLGWFRRHHGPVHMVALKKCHYQCNVLELTNGNMTFDIFGHYHC